MKPMPLLLACICFAATLPAADATRATPAENLSCADRMLADYFRAETARLAERCLADIKTLDDWKAKRQEYRRQLQEMLGLWPMPERTDLKPVITGRLEHEQFTVEKLHFQASPGLYVTANLYLPRNLDKPAPTILYVCGHSRQIKDGVSFGNKAAYQHHGAWFARNGYVCLVIDTLQLGEIQGIHHGTHRYSMWWWNSRGYTPAGVETWFGIRALDYLETRPEVDKERIGITGRSGGGSYSWTVAALDERVRAVAPVAGITDLQNQVVDGCVEGHCDCMFFVNTYRWDFSQVAALIAPRPLLIGNTDKDKIFPLDGVVRLHEKVRKVYELHGATNHLGLLITEGPHKDTQDLQVPVFRWFNRFLKGAESDIEMAATTFFEPEQLKVFGQLPGDQSNTNIHEVFVAKAKPLTTPGTASEWRRQQESRLAALREKSFAGWPAEASASNAELYAHTSHQGLRYQAYGFSSQPQVDLWLHVLQDSKVRRPAHVALVVLDTESWTNWPAQIAWLSGEAPENADQPEVQSGIVELRRELQAGRLALAFFAPRGIGETAWSSKPAQATQIRRRFMLLGQTLDGMRVWDIRCAVQRLRSLPDFKRATLGLRAGGQMGVNALYAALFEPGVARVELANLPPSHRAGPDYLNVLKVLAIPQALQLAAERAEVKLR